MRAYISLVMSHKTFSVRIPIDVAEPLEAEASQEVRTLNQQITVILRDRYKTHSPPTPAHTRSKSPKGQQNGRKNKAAIS